MKTGLDWTLRGLERPRRRRSWKLWGVYTRPIITIFHMNLGNWAIIDCPRDQLTYCYYGRFNGKGPVFGPSTCPTGPGREPQPGCGAEPREAVLGIIKHFNGNPYMIQPHDSARINPYTQLHDMDHESLN